MTDDVILDVKNFEVSKFKNDASYHQSVDKILACNHPALDYIHHNGAFNGSANIARQLSLYELYKMTSHLAGHVAEIGVWKGASFLYWAKLVDIFEPNSNTLVHGLDWFQGMDPGKMDGTVQPGKCGADYNTLRNLIDIQDLGHIARLHKLDITKDLDKFFTTFSSAHFKLVFIDAGVYEVVKAAVTHFWPRLNTGGILVLDEFNWETSPGEAIAIRETLPNARIQSFSWTRQPSGYIVKDKEG